MFQPGGLLQLQTIWTIQIPGAVLAMLCELICLDLLISGPCLAPGYGRIQAHGLIKCLSQLGRSPAVRYGFMSLLRSNVPHPMNSDG